MVLVAHSSDDLLELRTDEEGVYSIQVLVVLILPTVFDHIILLDRTKGEEPRCLGGKFNHSYN